MTVLRSESVRFLYRKPWAWFVPLTNQPLGKFMVYFTLHIYGDIYHSMV